MTFVMNIQHMYNKKHLFVRYHAGNKNLSGMLWNAWNTKNLASPWICMVPIPACNYSCQKSCRILVSVKEHHPKLSYTWSFTNKPQSVWRDELCWLGVVQFCHQSPNLVLRRVSNLLKFIELSNNFGSKCMTSFWVNHTEQYFGKPGWIRRTNPYKKSLDKTTFTDLYISLKILRRGVFRLVQTSQYIIDSPIYHVL